MCFHDLYLFPGKHNPRSYDLWSKGPDKTDGTADDVGNWIEAAAQVDALLFAIENNVKWVDPDTFRDGAVVALIKTGQYNKARQVFTRLAERVQRKGSDLRVRMLGAAVDAVTAATTTAGSR